MKRIVLFLALLFAANGFTLAQSVTIDPKNTTGNNPNIIDIKSINQGIIIPKMTTVQKNAIANKAEGMMVYDIDLQQFSYWKTGAGLLGYWINFGNPPVTWAISGNDIFNSNSGNVGVGNNNPQATLDVQGDVRLRVATLSLPIGLNNNVDLQTLKSSVYNFQTNALGGVQISGFAGGIDGRIITIFNNLPSDAVQLYDESSGNALSSIAPNRILTGSGNTAIIYQKGTVMLRYDGEKQRWIVISSHFTDGFATNTAWNIFGNTATNANHFIGTNDAQPLRFKVSGGTAGIIDSANSIIGLGVGAMRKLVTNKNNVAIGSAALFGAGKWVNPYNTSYFISATQSVAIGDSALFNIGSLEESTPSGTLGTPEWPIPTEGNTAIGYKALFKNGYGSYNTALGTQALLKNTIGYKNNAFGSNALANNTKGVRNIAIGDSALNSNIFGSRNVSIGSRALVGSKYVSDCIAIGNQALSANPVVMHCYFNTNPPTPVTAGTVFSASTNPYDKVLVCPGDLSNTFINIAIGSSALANNSRGTYNIGIGYNALRTNIAGTFNTALGTNALENNSTNDNTAIGYYSLQQNTSGPANTAIGFESLVKNTTGKYNTASGVASLKNIITGDANTAIGVNAGPTNATFGAINNTISIGRDCENNTTNNVVIGNASNTGNYYIVGGTSWMAASDKRLKKNIQENVPGLAFINKLRPVTYNYSIDAINKLHNSKDTTNWKGKYDAENIKFTGFIAQEVEQVAKDCNYNFSGVRAPEKGRDWYAIGYSDFVMPLVKAVQEQQLQIEELKSDNAKLKVITSQLEILQAQMNELKSSIKKNGYGL